MNVCSSPQRKSKERDPLHGGEQDRLYGMYDDDDDGGEVSGEQESDSD